MGKLILAAVFCLASASAQAYNIDEIEAPVCILQRPGVEQPASTSPGFTRVNIIITDGLAQVEMSQTYINPFPEESEAVYVFPLPQRGSVHGMSFTYRDSVYIGEIKERQAAIAAYDSILLAGGQAALLLEQKPNVFQQRLANIAGGDSIKVEISLSVPLKYIDGFFEFRFPTMVALRYESGGAIMAKGSAAAADSFPYTLWNPPEDRDGARLQINVVLISGCGITDISSPSHPVYVSEVAPVALTLLQRGVIRQEDVMTLPNRKAVLLASQTAYPNKDYVLRFRRSENAHDISLASYRLPGADTGYFMLNLYPDLDRPEAARPPLEVIMMVDISGSQGGYPIEQEKIIAGNILTRLSAEDRLSLLSFNTSNFYAFSSQLPVPVTAQNLAIAENFISGLAADGGTELLNAVTAALSVPSEGGMQRIFIFLTDGFITNEEAILAEIAGHPSSPTIFTFGAGGSLNHFFLERSAEIGNGFATTLMPGEDPIVKVDEAWSRISAPQLDNITVSFGMAGVFDVLLPGSSRLYRGMPYQVFGKYTGAGAATVTIQALLDGQPYSLTKAVVFTSSDPLSWSVEKIWAREKISDLLMDDYAAPGTMQDEIIAVSTKYQVLSPYTAFLASSPMMMKDAFASSGAMYSISAPLEIETVRSAALVFSLKVSDGLMMLTWTGDGPAVSIRIFDVRGMLVMEWTPSETESHLQAFSWDGRLVDGSRLMPGLYTAAVNMGTGMQSRVFSWQ